MTYTTYSFQSPTLSRLAAAALDLFHLPDGVSYDEKARTYTLEVELPGYARGDVSVEVLDGVLTVKAENARRGKVSREWLVDGIDETAVKAALADGVLTVSLPQVEAPEARKIAVS